jgi:hypothetical protein
MDADPNGQCDVPLAPQTIVESSQLIDDADSTVNSASRIILSGDWVTEVHEQSVTEVLGDVAAKALDDAIAHLLIGLHYVAQDLRIEPCGELRRANEVAEQHCELPTFGVCRFVRLRSYASGAGDC